MTKRDFFIIVIRIIGLYGFLHSLFLLINKLILLIEHPVHLKSIYTQLEPVVLNLLIWFLIIYYSVYLVKLLGLDKGFDDKDIHLGDISLKKILIFAIIIVGGIAIINSLAEIFYTVSLLLRNWIDPNYKLFGRNEITHKLIVSTIKFGLGIFLLSKYNSLADKLMIKDKKA